MVHGIYGCRDSCDFILILAYSFHGTNIQLLPLHLFIYIIYISRYYINFIMMEPNNGNVFAVRAFYVQPVLVKNGARMDDGDCVFLVSPRSMDKHALGFIYSTLTHTLSHTHTHTGTRQTNALTGILEPLLSITTTFECSKLTVQMPCPPIFVCNSPIPRPANPAVCGTYNRYMMVI